ncbi:MAG: amidohydrolase family protein [Bacillota bacterium]
MACRRDRRGGLSDMEKLKPMVKLLKRCGFFICVHLAPPSIPGSAWLKAGDIIELEPDKVAHVNGGTTSSSWEEIKTVIDQSRAGIELIPEGNAVKFIKTLEYLASRKELHRVVFGSDAPTGACSLPGAMNKAIVKAASLAGIPAPQAIAMATGNTARLYGLSVGEIRAGREADLVVIDAPPGCEGEDALSAIEVGDLFGCSLVVADGRIRASRGRDTRATRRVCSINGAAYAPKDIHEFLYNPPML